MSSIADNIRQTKASLPDDVTLVAVSKFKSCDDIMEAYGAGQRVFGESRALELRDKHEALPKDIQWHFIGHLQTNKIKYIIPFVTLIHSIDSLKLLEEVDAQARNHGRSVDCKSISRRRKRNSVSHTTSAGLCSRNWRMLPLQMSMWWV